jgi:phosphate transport system permease protein
MRSEGRQQKGDVWVWLNAAGVTLSLLMVVGLVAHIAWKGLVHFWPQPIEHLVVRNQTGAKHLLGELADKQERHDAQGAVVEGEFQRLYKIGNRRMNGQDFVWVNERDIQSTEYPDGATVLERLEWGNAYGFLEGVEENGKPVLSREAPDFLERLQERHNKARALFASIHEIEKNDIGSINYSMEQLRLEKRRLELDGELTREAEEDLKARQEALQQAFAKLQERLKALRQQASRDTLVLRLVDGSISKFPLYHVVRYYQPNGMGSWQKLGVFLDRIWEFLSAEPREANTEGGVFPAIFGTVLMVLLMSVMVTPFGVIAAVYLREYATQGWLTRTVRIAVNNLAGVPSIVYGVFGLGFFVYFLGGNIDALFFPEAKPAPVFGTPGLLWASLTLALLTLPVVIVSTEEGLTRVPKAVREGSLALGATKAETLWKTVLPMASPSIMTGLILAIARAAGEVAPLMLVGVVKLAPSLPLDGNPPFLHLDRQFMHLGFHIYDVGFQSPNVEAARPLVYATSLLLVMVIVLLNLLAIRIRNRLRERYKALEH